MENAVTDWSIRGALASALIAGTIVGAQALPVYDSSAVAELIGSRSIGSGLVKGGGNVTAATFGWNIAYNTSTSLWRYEYRFTENSRQSISHFVLDLSDNCSATSNCVMSFVDSSTNADSLVYGSFASNGNPNFAGTIVGIKFDDLESENPYTFSFFSERAPVYGDMYTKGGNGRSNGFAIYNAGAANHGSTLIIDFIARPDTITGPGPTPGGALEPVPEPASLLLLGLGLAGLAAGKRRRA